MRTQAFLPLFLCLSSAVSTCAVLPTTAHADPATPAATIAPSFDLPTLTGTVDTDSLRGHVVLVDFWASWCLPCAESFPWLASMQEQYGDQGLRVVAVDLDKQRELAEKFLRRHPAPFTVAFDPAGGTAEAFGVEAMPSSFLIGPDGAVLFTKRGFDAEHTAEFEARIREACQP
jgi:cytochrome c biogenesis protein CcmG/thiol:disulfide interchange protein DsbE